MRHHDRPDWDMGWRDWVSVLGASLGAFLAILDIQITNASLKEIQEALDLDPSDSGWISTAYLIAEISIIPLSGALGRVLGLRSFAVGAASVFMAASIACGLALDFKSLILARVVQGVSGGTLVPVAFQILLQFMPLHRRNVGLAIFGLSATLAPTLGPTLGGWITEWASWRWTFLLNIPPCLVLISALRVGLPYTRPDRSHLQELDGVGALTLVLALASGVFVLEEGAKRLWFEDAYILVAMGLCALAALVHAGGYWLRSTERRPPILDFSLLKDGTFLVACGITLTTAAALFSGIFSLSLFLGQVQGYRPIEIGSVMMWVGIPQLVLMPLMPWILRHCDPRWLIAAGLVLFECSHLMNSSLTLQSSGDVFVSSLWVRALGQPLILVPLSAIATRSIAVSKSAQASALFNVARNLGGSIGIALTGTWLTTHQEAHALRHLAGVEQPSEMLQSTVHALTRQYWEIGLDQLSATGRAWTTLNEHLMRESFVEAFNDVYSMSTWMILLSLALIFVLPKTAPIAGSGDLTHSEMH